jgi:hypothetical protein
MRRAGRIASVAGKQFNNEQGNAFMQKKLKRAAGRLAALACTGLACLALMAGTARRAQAQEIQPYEFTPLPAGTNLIFGYYLYGHNTDFNFARGSTIKDSGVEINVGVARYVHFVDIKGYPAGFQIVQIFGSQSAAHIDGQRLGSAFGAQNIALSAFIFPYVNTATKTNANVTVWLYPPTGSYDRRSLVNLGDNRWRGDLELGLSQGIGERFAFDAEYDIQFYGDNDKYFPGSRRLSQDPTHRIQFWANWRWNPALSTSVGYEGLFGGDQKVNDFPAGTKTEVQRIRANAALFLSPTVQTMLELNHDVHVVGGFKQEFGATLRVLKVF